MHSLQDKAAAVLKAADLDGKCAAAHDLRRAALAKNGLSLRKAQRLPNRPARPDKPVLVNPGDVPRRRLGSKQGRFALLHAVAHIEFNAIDLAADMIARFADHTLIPERDLHDFILDWSSVADDEARHFAMVRARLRLFGGDYGDLPAHDGLWQAAFATRHDVLARLAIAPMVLEARGLDVTPAMIRKLRKVGDPDSADILQVIYDDEIGHVAAGKRWFSQLSGQDFEEQTQTFHHLVKTYYNGLLKPPFNVAARDLAGMPRQFYEPLAQFP